MRLTTSLVLASPTGRSKGAFTYGMSREFDTVTQRKGSQRGRRGPGKDTTSAKSIEVVSRHAQWVRDRLAHMSYRAIAARDGVDVATVHEAVKRALARTVDEPTQELRAVELEQLDELIRTVWKAALSGDLESWEAARKGMADRRKMLGLDAPQKLEISRNPEELWASVREWLRSPTPELEAALREAGWTRS